MTDQANFRNPFKVEGYSIDYIVDGKYFGSVRVDEMDREEFGYWGRRTEELKEDLTIRNKTIPKGTVVVTELQIICGKRKIK